MSKKIITAFLALSMLLCLCGCQCRHEWVEADCVTPQTCAKCGETEGDALGHIWQEANYQDPETCTVCGETKGAPLPAAFEEHDLEINLHENRHYTGDSTYTALGFEPIHGFSYVTCCYKNETKKTTANLYICNYRIFESDDTHKAVDGYEWRAFDVEIDFHDENAWDYGYTWANCWENYYDIEGWDNSSSDIADTQWEYLIDQAEGYSLHNISYHGESYPVIITQENTANDGWSLIDYGDGNVVNHSVAHANYYACVPVGYDGVVIGFYDAAIKWEDGMYIYDLADENTLFFRMGALDESIQERVADFMERHK